MSAATPTLYKPPQEVLNKYAKVLVNFALNSGQGVKPGDVVQITVPEIAKRLAIELRNEVLKAGAHPMMKIYFTGGEKDFYQLANDDQLTFFPKKYEKARADLVDHQVVIVADPYPFELAEIDPARIIKARDSKKQVRDWFDRKEDQGKFTWTVALWGVEAKAKEVGLSLSAYWQQIIRACYLDVANPIKKWQAILAKQQAIRKTLDDLKIEQVHVIGQDTDIWLKIGADRVWNGGSGRNVPSFEIFTSPDWRDVEGYIRFNEPFYRYGNLIEDIFLRLKKGKVVEAKARKGNKFLQAMLQSKNADKIGEFSLTDSRMSRITHPMAEILFDENMGGKFGNMHLAIGRSYVDCYRGDASQLSKKDRKAKGFNDAAEHSDFVQTTDRTVTAVLPNGQEKVIYKNGKFVI